MRCEGQSQPCDSSPPGKAGLLGLLGLLLPPRGRGSDLDELLLLVWEPESAPGVPSEPFRPRSLWSVRLGVVLGKLCFPGRARGASPGAFSAVRGVNLATLPAGPSPRFSRAEGSFPGSCRWHSRLHPKFPSGRALSGGVLRWSGLCCCARPSAARTKDFLDVLLPWRLPCFYCCPESCFIFSAQPRLALSASETHHQFYFMVSIYFH